MQLKSNETPNGNVNTNGAPNPYGSSQPRNSYYDTPDDVSSQQYGGNTYNGGGQQYGGNAYNGGQQAGSQYGGSSQYGGNTYNGGQQTGAQNTTPYGTPKNNTTPYGTPQQAYGVQPTTIHKKGVNPLFIILPIAVVIVLICVSLYGKVFGSRKYDPGTITGNVYTSEHFGFKASFEADGWTVKGSDYSSPEQIKSALNKGSTVSELYVQNTSSVELMDFSVYQTPFNIDNNNSNIKSVMEDCKDFYVQQLESQGFTVESVEQDTMTIAGKTCNGYYIKCKMDGVSVGLVQFFMFEGRYLGYFTAGSTSSAKAKLIITNHVQKLD